MRFSQETPFSRPTWVCCTCQIAWACAMGHSPPWLLHATTNMANGRHARMQGYTIWAVCTLQGNRHYHVLYALHLGIYFTWHVYNITSRHATCNVVPRPVHAHRACGMQVQEHDSACVYCWQHQQMPHMQLFETHACCMAMPPLNPALYAYVPYMRRRQYQPTPDNCTGQAMQYSPNIAYCYTKHTHYSVRQPARTTPRAAHGCVS